MKKIYFITIVMFLVHLTILNAQSCDQTVSFYHSTITDTQLNQLMSDDGVSTGLSQNFNSNYVYKITINGGGGYYTHTLMMMCLDNVTPLKCIVKGETDADDANRTRIGTDNTFTNLFDFNGLGWQDATSYTGSDELFLELNSKWGSDIDTYIYMYIATNQKISQMGYALLDEYDDDFGSISVDAYQRNTSDVSELYNNKLIKVFPNPFTTSVNIISESNNYSSLSLEVYDIRSKKVYLNHTSKNNVAINLSELKQGYYLLFVKNPSGKLIHISPLIKK